MNALAGELEDRRAVVDASGNCPFMVLLSAQSASALKISRVVLLKEFTEHNDVLDHHVRAGQVLKSRAAEIVA